MSPSDQAIRNRLFLARLPAMPQILLKLLELCQAEGIGMAEIAKVIANDAGMTTKVLGVANSVAYHREGQKVGLIQALSVLGADMIKTLVISESVFQTFNGFPNAAGIDLRSFWKHALGSAVMAREIAKKMGYPQIEEAYLAGLLHDVGRLALLAIAPKEYGPFFLAQDNENLCAIEQRTFQISHTEAGAWLIEHWNLDSFMADALLYHHEDTDRVATAHALIRIVHLAHRMACSAPNTTLIAGAGALCLLSDEDLLVISLGADAQVIKSAAYLGLDLSGVDDLVMPSAHIDTPPVKDAAQQRLTEEVRHMTLMAELQQSFSQQKSDAQLLDVIRQNALILFNLEDSIIFLKNGSGQSLVGVSVGASKQRLADFTIPLAGTGGIAESAVEGKLIFLGRDRPLVGLAEDQLLRIFAVECLVCVPIANGSHCLGVLVAGVPAGLLDDLQQRTRFLKSFGAHAATALDAASRERGEIDQRIVSVREEYRESALRVAHEINNPLSIIKNYLGVLDEKLTRQESVTKELGILNEEIDRVGSIMNEFAGSAPRAQVGHTDINKVVNDLVYLFRESRFLPATVQILVQLPTLSSEIEGAADTLKQILVNLIKNAVEAMPDGGYIEITNHGQVQRDGKTFFQLSIKDNGVGMPAEVLAKLFTPVRSSKQGDNRGIGLSIVHSLLNQMGGAINCPSAKIGTTFELLLPIRNVLIQNAAPERIRDEA